MIEERRSIKDPIPEIFEAYVLLSNAADAHISGDYAGADLLFRRANMPEIWHWLNSAWSYSEIVGRIKVREPAGDTTLVAKSDRAPSRIPPDVKAAVLARDGYRCRYCGAPVVDAEIRKIAKTLYPDAVPWVDHVPEQQHAAFQCLWLQYDHVVPRSHGGPNTEDNLVVTCALCNFGKDKYTLKQLGIRDPRERAPKPSPWDGIERLRPYKTRVSKAEDSRSHNPSELRTSIASKPPWTFFLPGAWISAGYLTSPPIAGKARWFKLGTEVKAEETVREGVAGCRLICDASHFIRRGLSPEEFLDVPFTGAPN